MCCDLQREWQPGNIFVHKTSQEVRCLLSFYAWQHCDILVHIKCSRNFHWPNVYWVAEALDIHLNRFSPSLKSPLNIHRRNHGNLHNSYLHEILQITSTAKFQNNLKTMYCRRELKAHWFPNNVLCCWVDEVPSGSNKDFGTSIEVIERAITRSFTNRTEKRWDWAERNFPHWCAWCGGRNDQTPQRESAMLTLIQE